MQVAFLRVYIPASKGYFTYSLNALKGSFSLTYRSRKASSIMWMWKKFSPNTFIVRNKLYALNLLNLFHSQLRQASVLSWWDSSLSAQKVCMDHSWIESNDSRGIGSELDESFLEVRLATIKTLFLESRSRALSDI